MDSVIRLRRRKLLVLGTLALGSLAGACFVKPIAQDPGYHRLADARTLLGVPNFFNVASNLPFLVAGIFGLYNAVRKPDAHHSRVAELTMAKPGGLLEQPVGFCKKAVTCSITLPEPSPVAVAAVQYQKNRIIC